MPPGIPWSEEEDRILLAYDTSAEWLEALERAGYKRTPNAALSRRKYLRQKSNAQRPLPAGTGLAQERDKLEREVRELHKRLAQARRRLLNVRVAQVKEAFGDVPVPEELLDALRQDLSESEA